MSSPAPFDISQNDTEILEKQWQEIQWRHGEEQWLLAQLKEVAKLCWAEHVAQKARREAEKKAYEEAERQRVAEEKERKRWMVEYLQWLQDEVLEEEATLLEGAEKFQVAGFKHKEVADGDKEGQRSSKKFRGKQQGEYRGDTAVKMGGSNLCERCVCAGQDCQDHRK